MIIEYGPLSTAAPSIRNYGSLPTRNFEYKLPSIFEITGCVTHFISNIAIILQFIADKSLLRTSIFDIMGYAHHTILNIAIWSPNSIS